MRTKLLAVASLFLISISIFSLMTSSHTDTNGKIDIYNVGTNLQASDGNYIVQWSRSYGKIPWWSARYEGPQPVGDADNDGKNELLIGGRDPFLRVMKWDEERQTYYEQAKIIDPVFGIGYSIGFRISRRYKQRWKE